MHRKTRVLMIHGHSLVCCEAKMMNELSYTER